MSRDEQNQVHALRSGQGGGASRGDGERYERRGSREWGGRVGARLDELDSAARSAVREAARAMRRRRLAASFAVPLAVLAVFSIALALGRRRRDRHPPFRGEVEHED